MLHLLIHPLAAHVVTHLRDRTTKPATFRTLAYQISLLLALEATRDLATREKTVQTPLEPHSGSVLSQPIVLVPILRAGIAMVQPFTDLFPDVTIGYIGLERDEQTAVARSYYCKLPPLGSKKSAHSRPDACDWRFCCSGNQTCQCAQTSQTWGLSVLSAPRKASGRSKKLIPK